MMKNLGILFSVAGFLLVVNFAMFYGTETVTGQSEKFVRSTMPVKGRYIVVLNDNNGNSRSARERSTEAKDSLAERFDADVKGYYTKTMNGFVAEMSEKQALRLSMDPTVKYVEEDSVAFVNSVQTNAIWGLDRIDQNELPLNNTYIYPGTGQGVNAYILDTGIRPTHEEIAGRAFAVFDSIRDGQNGIDCHGHGTHVAGTIGSSTYGVAKNVTLHGVRVLPCSGYGLASQIVEGIDWVTENRIDPAVGNISIGVSGISPSIRNAINTSVDSGVTWVVAAGNQNANACDYSPSNTELAITVGATGYEDARAGYSNHGPCVDIFAPGTGILSIGHNSDNELRTRNGTSSSSPMVAGVAALYLEANPNASPTEVKNKILQKSSDGVLTNLTTGSPNKLLYAWLGDDAPQIPGMITIIKEVHTMTGGTSSTESFDFTASNLSNSEFVLIDNNEVPADRYIETAVFPSSNDFDQITVELGEKEGWLTSDISCVESSIAGMPSLPNSTVDISTRQANLKVEEGESITCKFVSYQLAPTSAPASIGGRVVSEAGRGIGRIEVRLHAFDGSKALRTMTSPFGYYQFDGLRVSNLYSVEVIDSRYMFDTPLRSIFIDGSVTNLDFIAKPNIGQRR